MTSPLGNPYGPGPREARTLGADAAARSTRDYGQEYVARDVLGGGITLHVGPVSRLSAGELQPVEHRGTGVLSQHLTAGYQGTGPLDTSLSILVHALDEQPMWNAAAATGVAPTVQVSRARALHRDFMRDVISRMPQHGGWALPRADVLRWAERALATKAKGTGPLGR